jgi:hypothetical protein
VGKLKLKRDGSRFWQNFLSDRRGIVTAGIVAICFIFLSSILWLVGALIVNRTFDAFLPLFNDSDPRALLTGQHAVNAFGVSIVVIDVLLLVWWGLNAQRVESQEYAGGVM